MNFCARLGELEERLIALGGDEEMIDDQPLAELKSYLEVYVRTTPQPLRGFHLEFSHDREQERVSFDDELKAVFEDAINVAKEAQANRRNIAELEARLVEETRARREAERTRP